MAGVSRYNIESLSLDDYKALLEGREYPLYFASWWLQVVMPLDEWVCLACYDAGRCLALFVARLRGGQIVTPPYCQYTGVLFLEDALTSYEKQTIIQVFHYQVPSHTYYHLNYSPDYIDWLGLYWLGYGQSTRYNYVWDVAMLQTAEDIRSAISASLRKNLKSTERAGFVYLPSVQLSDVKGILSSTASYKGYRGDLPLMLRLMHQGLVRGEAQVIGVANAMGELAMVAFWVEHQGVAYLIGEGTDRLRGGKYQLKVFMLMNYILSRRQTIRKIDFEGSMLEPIAKIYQALRADQQSYMTITKGWRYHPRVLWCKLFARWGEKINAKKK